MSSGRGAEYISGVLRMDRTPASRVALELTFRPECCTEREKVDDAPWFPVESARLFLEFLEAIKKASAMRTLESLARIEAGAEGGALVERTTTTRTAKDGTATTTVRERYTPPRPATWCMGDTASASLLSF